MNFWVNFDRFVTLGRGNIILSEICDKPLNANAEDIAIAVIEAIGLQAEE